MAKPPVGRLPVLHRWFVRHAGAIQAVYPQSRLQRCIVHQIRSSTRFVRWKDSKQVVTDLKKIYTAVTLDEAEDALLQFGEK